MWVYILYHSVVGQPGLCPTVPSLPEAVVPSRPIAPAFALQTDPSSTVPVLVFELPFAASGLPQTPAVVS